MKPNHEVIAELVALGESYWRQALATASEGKQEEGTLLPPTGQATASAAIAGAAAKERSYREPTIAEGMAIIAERAQPVKGGRF